MIKCPGQSVCNQHIFVFSHHIHNEKLNALVNCTIIKCDRSSGLIKVEFIELVNWQYLEFHWEKCSVLRRNLRRNRIKQVFHTTGIWCPDEIAAWTKCV